MSETKEHDAHAGHTRRQLHDHAARADAPGVPPRRPGNQRADLRPYRVVSARIRPDGHTHATEEEAIYVLSGRGRIVTPDGVAELEPGVFVLIHPGTFHATETSDSEGLELLCIFSPPVVLGSYEVRST